MSDDPVGLRDVTQALQAVVEAAPRHGEAGLPGDPLAMLLGQLARSLGEALGLAPERLASTTGLPTGPTVSLPPRLVDLPAGPDRALAAAFRLGQVHELLLALDVQADADRVTLLASTRRKRRGAYYTTRRLTALVLERALAGLDGPLRLCDPAVGGGAFLLEACRALADRSATGSAAERLASRRRVARQSLVGVDVSSLAVAVTRAAFWLLLEDPAEDDLPTLAVGDALLGRTSDDEGDLPTWVSERLREARPRAPASALAAALAGARPLDWGGPLAPPFDLVVGNPPWVAFAGRATAPLDPLLRAHFARTYEAFGGYPTLHGAFVERACGLAPEGRVALLLPSPVADLQGYAGVRRAVARRHTAAEPLLELGEDAFAGVVQPSFLLLALPGGAPATGAPWRLEERRRAGDQAASVEAPEALARWLEGPALAAECFREMGFQSNSAVTRELFRKGEDGPHEGEVPLLQGRDVQAFEQRSPRLFLRADGARLAELRVRLRPVTDYRAVPVVVRQTAAFPIAARHGGEPFRNTLLAAFPPAGWSPRAFVGWLNSTLVRACHLARHRDARQGVFPQVKIRHLRELPAPPPGLVPELLDGLVEACEERRPGARAALDAAVFTAGDVSPDDAATITAFARAVAPASVGSVE